MDSQKLGERGEDIAEEYLRQKGYTILERNYIPKAFGPRVGEIDIIAKKGRTIFFVEVKSSFSPPKIMPEERVNFRKRRKILKTASYYLAENNLSSWNWQFDVISLWREKEKTILRHIENIETTWRDISF